MEKGGGGGGKPRPTRGEATSFGFKRVQPAPQPQPVRPSEGPKYGFSKPGGKTSDGNGLRKASKSEPAPASFKKSSATSLVSQPQITVQETIQPLLIAPVQPKPPPNVNGHQPRDKPVNRFGFRPPPPNKVGDVEPSPVRAVRSQSEPRKCRLEWACLPKAQHAVRLPAAVGYSPEADKRAKTAANTAISTVVPPLQSDSSSRVSKSSERLFDSDFEIQELEQSPSAGHKFRQTQAQLQRLHEASRVERQTPPTHEKIKSRNGVSYQREERGVTEGRGGVHCRVPTANSLDLAFSSNEETGDEGFDEVSTEEKQTRDKEANEKDILGCDESPTEEMWGRGEAMAIEEELCANFSAIESPVTPPLRSVLLKIEDPTFAPLAAMSQSALLEDETQPDSPDLSCSSPSSVEPLPPPPLSLSAKDSPATPGTPTHGTTSLSGSDTRDRDFLIDDEIADQPGLVFGHRTTGHKLADTSRKISKLVDEVSEALASMNPKLSGSRQSVSTLSPCESLTSDDLMADFDTSDLSNFGDLDEAALKSELQTQSGQVMREWSSLLSSHPGLKNGSRRRSRPSGGSVGELTVSSRLDSPQSPFRGKRINVNSPGDDGSDDSGIRVDRDTYEHMFQDVINIRAMLVRLQRVLQEEGGDRSSQEAEGEELADLRRQVVLVSAQVEERDRRILRLEEELAKARRRTSSAAAPPLGQTHPLETPAQPKQHSNKATQTDRIRPVSTSQALFQSSPDKSNASFVSC